MLGGLNFEALLSGGRVYRSAGFRADGVLSIPWKRCGAGAGESRV